MANFPAAPDNITEGITPGTSQSGATSHSALHNQIADAVNAIEAELLTGGSLSLDDHLVASDPHPQYGQVVNARALGAIGDNTSHPITAEDITDHPEWIGTYAEGDEWDYVGLQETIYECFASRSTPGNVVWNGYYPYGMTNKPMFIPAGWYSINRTLEFEAITGGLIEGAGRLATTISKTTPGHCVSTNQFSYSCVRGISFNGTNLGAGQAVFNLDWDGASHGGVALQANTFQDCLFGGSNTEYGLKIGAGGYMGSENLMINCHFTGLSVAGVSTHNYNALQNTLVGGNVQSCPSAGVLMVAGAIYCWSVGFQNGTTETTQTGYDIVAQNSANDACTSRDCRTESLRHMNAHNSKVAIVDGLQQAWRPAQWAPSTAFAEGALISGTDGAGNDGCPYQCVTAGTSGGTEPTWTGGNGITDGTAIWDIYDVNTINTSGPMQVSSSIIMGQITTGQSGAGSSVRDCVMSRPDWMSGQGWYDIAPATTRIDNVVVRPWGTTGSNLPWDITSTNAHYTGAPLEGTTMLNVGMSHLRFDGGTGGQTWDPVALFRGDGVNLPGTDSGGYSADKLSRNVLALIGTLGKAPASGTDQAGETLYLQGGLSTGTAAGGAISLRAGVGGASGTTINNGAERMRVEPSGVRFQMYTMAGAPTTSDIPAGMCAVYKDSGAGTVRLYVNDGGTLKSVALS